MKSNNNNNCNNMSGEACQNVTNHWNAILSWLELLMRLEIVHWLFLPLQCNAPRPILSLPRVQKSRVISKALQSLTLHPGDSWEIWMNPMTLLKFRCIFFQFCLLLDSSSPFQLVQFNISYFRSTGDPELLQLCHHMLENVEVVTTDSEWDHYFSPSFLAICARTYSTYTVKYW